MAPGAISMAMARMMPTACSAATTVSDDEREQAVVQQTHRQADGPGVRRVEGVQQEAAPLDEDDERSPAWR